MAVGLAATTFANKVLDHMLRAVASTAPASNNVALHTADPGAAGTTAATTGTVGASRKAVTFSAASGGSCASSNTPSWAVWDGGSVTISHISVWDALTAGTFLYSAVLTTAKAITAGDTFTLSSLTVSLAPLAA
jgi:hypothetical protein